MDPVTRALWNSIGVVVIGAALSFAATWFWFHKNKAIAEARRLADEQRELQKSRCQCWLLSNWGNPISLHNTRRDAIEQAVTHTGHPWNECRDYMEVRKATVTEGWR